MSAKRSGNSAPDACRAALIATSQKARSEKTWIITDGSVGMEAQGIAVAEAVGLPFSLKAGARDRRHALLPAPLQILVPPARLLRFVASNEPLEAPWPRLIISIGRRSVPIALAIKRLSKPHAFALHIQNPKVPARLFDLIAAPVHDGFEAPNVITTFGAVHSVTADAACRSGQALRAAHRAPAPSAHRRPARRREPGLQLPAGGRRIASAPSSRGLPASSGGSLLVTPSRRTRADSLAALAAAIKDVPQSSGTAAGDNPYFAFLALADAIVVTEDSVNMVTEAAGTGKPVYVQSLPGRRRGLPASTD